VGGGDVVLWILLYVYGRACCIWDDVVVVVNNWRENKCNADP
jgi:hypothetical protein